jgi:hypothetical protein
MGWLWMHKPKGLKVTDFILNHAGVFRWSDSPYEYKVLDTSIVELRTLYAAVEQVHKETGERRVWAAILLLGFAPKDEYSFGYKDMDESCGPCEARCPERILDLLTETTYEHAIDWRRRCREYHAARKARPKIKIGDTLVYGGKPYRVVSRWTRAWQIRSESGTIYRMTDARARRAEVRPA